MTQSYIICADGACSGNPGPGGYAWELWADRVADGNESGSGAGSLPATTNNVMELKAAIGALEFMAEGLERQELTPGHVLLRLDSQYVLNGMFDWVSGWKARGWKTASNKPVKNKELWQALDALHARVHQLGCTLAPQWVKGHAGDVGNERVDAKAVEMRDSALEDIPVETQESMPTSSPAPTDDIDIRQVELMTSILDMHRSGHASVRDVIRKVREHASDLGCR